MPNVKVSFGCFDHLVFPSSLPPMIFWTSCLKDDHLSETEGTHSLHYCIFLQLHLSQQAKHCHIIDHHSITLFISRSCKYTISCCDSSSSWYRNFSFVLLPCSSIIDWNWLIFTVIRDFFPDLFFFNLSMVSFFICC